MSSPSSSPPHTPGSPGQASTPPSRADAVRDALRGPLGLLLAFLIVDACVLGIHLVNELSGRRMSQFDLEQEQNLPTWVSTIQLAGVLFLAAAYARFSSGRTRLAMAVFAAIFAFLSLDELALIHEQVIQKVTGSVTNDPWYWPVFYAPLALALLLSTAGVALEARRMLGSLLHPLVPLAMLCTSIVLDSAATRLRGSAVFDVAVVVEEALELAGGALLIFVLFHMLLLRLGLERRDAAAPRRRAGPGEAPARGPG